jgi:hypothetical protein
VNDAFATDTEPRFPLPDDFTQPSTIIPRFTGLDNVIVTWNALFADLTDITLALSAISSMAQAINDTAGKALPWQDVWFMSLNFTPLLQQLLSLSRNNLVQLNLEPGIVIREVLRLTCILFLGIISGRFHGSLDGNARYVNGVMKLLMKTALDWSPLLKLHLWVLVITAMAAEGRERIWLIGKIFITMKQLNLNTWIGVLSIVKDIIWVDEVLDDGAEKLGSEAEEISSTF